MDDEAIVAQALSIVERGLKDPGEAYDNTSRVSDFLRLKMSAYEREVFAVMLLDTRHRLIEFTELFYGTVNKAHVYPREIVKASLAANAAAVILAHNHPSGVAEPSSADLVLTKQLKEALALLDITVLDHFVVSQGTTVSLAARGLL